MPYLYLALVSAHTVACLLWDGALSILFGWFETEFSVNSPGCPGTHYGRPGWPHLWVLALTLPNLVSCNFAGSFPCPYTFFVFLLFTSPVFLCFNFPLHLLLKPIIPKSGNFSHMLMLSSMFCFIHSAFSFSYGGVSLKVYLLASLSGIFSVSSMSLTIPTYLVSNPAFEVSSVS